MQKALSPFFQVSLCIVGYLLTHSGIALAQVTSDGTVNTNVNQNGSVAEITGGETREGNLFHSFQDFSIPTGNEAFFNNANDISNIFSRITGGNISKIDGLIRSNGSANLFLINPAGIIFGENASLDIGGSFYGSSASSILFEDGEFSAADFENPPLLTVNAPIGLGFRDNPGNIVNRASTGDSLEVSEGQNISLIGGNVSVEDGGIIFAPGGRIELGGLLEAGKIDIAEDSRFSFPDGIARGDVSLTNSSNVAVFSDGGGSIGVNTANLEISSGSSFLGGIRAEFGSIDAQAGDIVVNATDSVLIDGQGDNNTGIFADVRTNSTGNAGDINIIADSFFLNDAAQISSSTSGIGNAGNIFVNVRDSIFIDGQEGTSFNTNILAIALDSSANAGNINLMAESLTLNNGATLATLGDNQSSGGDINIRANDIVSLANQSNITTVTGSNGGSLTVDANSLEITSGSNFSAGINLNSGSTEAQAGDITINVIEDILVDGLDENPQIQTNITNSIFEGGEGIGGNITINAQNIDLKNGGNVFSFNSGQASLGNITLTAIEDISLDGVRGSFRSGVSSFIAETGTGDVGNIEISAQNLIITNGANIQSLVAGMANSGGININVADTVLIDGVALGTLPDGGMATVNSEILSEVAGDGNGNSGNINLTTSSLLISLTIKGKGGVPAAPESVMDSQNIYVNGEDVNSTVAIPQSIETSKGKIQLARGIRVKQDGGIVLTAYRTNNLGARIPGSEINCDR